MLLIKTIEEIQTTRDHLRLRHKIPFGMPFCYSDQFEYMMDFKEEKIPANSMIVIDEFNVMDTTGENSTTENAFFEHTSDVMAQEFVHKIACSPSTQIDKNSNILLHVFAKDVDKKVTHCKLYYKTKMQGYDFNQLLGTVSLSVADVLESDWYQDYMIRKKNIWKIMRKHGIMHKRDLYYAPLIIEVVDLLKKPCMTTSAITQSTIRNYVEDVAIEHKMILSMLGLQSMVIKVSGILDMYKQIYKHDVMIEKYRNLYKKTNDIVYKLKMETLQEVKRTDLGIAERQLQRQRKNIDIFKEYKKVKIQASTTTTN